MELDPLFFNTFDSFVTNKLVYLTHYPRTISASKRNAIKYWIQTTVNPNRDIRTLVNELCNRIVLIYHNLFGISLNQAQNYFIYSLILDWGKFNPKQYRRNMAYGG